MGFLVCCILKHLPGDDFSLHLCTNLSKLQTILLVFISNTLNLNQMTVDLHKSLCLCGEEDKEKDTGVWPDQLVSILHLYKYNSIRYYVFSMIITVKTTEELNI
ncbi:hypothetical protein AX774_g6284 [Zancudomyces culisetae]|uniref:Uncharacterized protein n=1 Tax=Zancudomyces culisetae TaxID=1213189 RepID=A0A1R1PH91_ZANCU|nr:hypothetical protein AX774_g6284 [Zancudomyces culisetae]|eukprot:OMH80283.1 hypothetical protein AX774_g6284 [Zancudomyces culisetae]